MPKKKPSPAVSRKKAAIDLISAVENDGLLYAVQNYGTDLEKACPKFNALAKSLNLATQAMEAYVEQLQIEFPLDENE